RILATAEDTGDAGQDKLYGRGIVDAHAALTADVEQTNANPMGSIQEWITMHRRGEIEDTNGTDDDREVAGPGEYPSQPPVAADQPEETHLVQPIVVVGFCGVFIAAVVAAIFLRQKHTGQANAPRLWSKLQ